MVRILFGVLIFCIAISGCASSSDTTIVKVVDFELSPDEDKIAFSAITPIGNTDIWVVDIDGTSLKKLTFKDRSPTNHLARFFKKRKWRNYFEIDMRYPKWTKDGRIAFCQKLSKHDMHGAHTVSLRYWTIKPDGTEKTPDSVNNEIIRRRPKRSEYSEKLKREILRKDGTLWILNDKETTPRKLIQ